MIKEIAVSLCILIFFFSCRGQNNTTTEKIDSSGTTHPSRVTEDNYEGYKPFDKDVQIIKKRNPFVYYKKYSFYTIDEAKSRLIFNNIAKLNIQEMTYDPLIGSSIISEGDVNYEEYLFDTLKLSNDELKNGIVSVLNEMNKLQPIQGLRLQGDEDDKKDFQTEIKYEIEFAEPIFNLKKKVSISKAGYDKVYVCNQTEVRNLTNFFISEWKSGGVFGETRNCTVISLLPALKNNKVLNIYYLNNTCGYCNREITQNEKQISEYFIIDKQTNKVLQTYSETVAYKPTGDDIQDRLMAKRIIYEPQFIVNENQYVLLKYLKVLFDRLRRNVERNA